MSRNNLSVNKSKNLNLKRSNTRRISSAPPPPPSVSLQEPKEEEKFKALKNPEFSLRNGFAFSSVWSQLCLAAPLPNHQAATATADHLADLVEDSMEDSEEVSVEVCPVAVLTTKSPRDPKPAKVKTQITLSWNKSNKFC